MKDLGKFLISLSLPLLFSINSKSQDFLPGKFRNYQKDRKGYILESRNILSSNFFPMSQTYVRKNLDLDNDSIIDVVEVYLVKLKRGKVRESKYPFVYFIKLGRDNIQMLIDENLDGLNNNEIIYEEPRLEENL